MKLAYLQKQSLIEFPGKISAVIFIGGCNLRCPFCYLPDLVLPKRIKKIKGIPQKEILAFLKERRKFLEGVAITGGEPTIYEELPAFISKIKKLNYSIEIETNGTNFKMIKFLTEKKLVDYLALDIKHDLNFSKYREVSGGFLTKEMFENIKESINFLLEGKINYELRTTLVKEFHRKEDILKICRKIKGAKIYWLQNYEKNETISGKNFSPFEKKEILEILKEGKKYVNLKARPYLL